MNQAMTVVIGLLPSIIWLIFFLQEDRLHPEPKKLIFFTFVLGMIATFFILQIQILLNKLFINLNLVSWSVVPIFALAAVEEIGKFLVVYLVIRRRKEFDEAIDPMIYMVVVALGFAAVENIASALRTIDSIQLTTLRFVGATLLHSLSSALVGYWWALSIYHKRHHLSDIAIGLFYASIFHFTFNYLTIQIGPGVIITLILIFAAFFILTDFEKLKGITIPLPEDEK